ncbi:putative oxidoreductase [Aspergillus bertholletiae]|uniref:Putative oxidoreductase n=1 Tax=Aspergillus bertholletiae TaxID=1226010 RepID=A0A5N7AW03_9EURO|nr:putative oxidoreductase [Aspergillus bertholletiae]
MALGVPPDQVASLEVVNLVQLLQGSHDAAQRLVRAARRDGMFYLEIPEGNEPGSMGRLVQGIYAACEELFRLPLDDKMKLDVDQLSEYKTNGYKPIGRNIGGLPGHRDGFESYAVSCGSRELGLLCWPGPLETYQEYLLDFSSRCYDILRVICQVLSAELNLPPGVSFEALHGGPDASFDIIRLLHYETGRQDSLFSVPQVAHTDLGSLTVLFSETPGLQVSDRAGSGQDKWLYVMPRRNCAVINLGDAMSLWSHGQFRSSVHRVASMPENVMPERYSFAFLGRPVSSAPMCPLTGGPVEEENILLCEDWVKEKFRGLRGQKKMDLCCDHT